MEVGYEINEMIILLASTLEKILEESLFTRLFSTHILVYLLKVAVRAMCLPCHILQCMASLLVTHEI